MLGRLGCGELVIIVGALAAMVFWIWTLVHVVTKERDQNTRVMWVIIIVFTHAIGALIYWIVRRAR